MGDTSSDYLDSEQRSPNNRLAPNFNAYHIGLLWEIKEKFGFHPAFADALSEGTGVTITQIINELDDRYA